MDGLAEIIKLLEEKLGPKRALALLYLVSIAIAVWAGSLIYRDGVLPLWHGTAVIVGYLEGNEPPFSTQDFMQVLGAIAPLIAFVSWFLSWLLIRKSAKRWRERRTDWDKAHKLMLELQTKINEEGAIVDLYSRLSEEHDKLGHALREAIKAGVSGLHEIEPLPSLQKISGEAKEKAHQELQDVSESKT